MLATDDKIVGIPHDDHVTRGFAPSPARSNEIWAMDFVHGQLATGRKLRVLTIVDTFSR
jgi:hypothetical protein